MVATRADSPRLTTPARGQRSGRWKGWLLCPLIGVGSLLQRYYKRQSRRNLYESLEAAIAAHVNDPGARTLNIGAGGEVQRRLAVHHISSLSIDIDPARGPDLVVDVQQMDVLGEASFTTVFCLEVLEHVPNPQAAVAEIQRVLRPGGLLIGSTPFLLGIHEHPHDYYRYTRFGLLHLFRNFECLQLSERTGYFQAIHVLCLRVFTVGTPRQRLLAWLLSPLILGATPGFWLLNRLLPNPDGTTGYFFVFRRR